MPMLIRIDKKVTGQDHSAYYERKVNEVLNESGIRVSLVGELDGQVVGFIMARVDYGEYDRTEPIAVLDTIGVHPDFGNKNVGSALLAQLLGNLATLRLDKIRTQVDADHFDVLSFLMKNGFYPSQELAFSYPMTDL
jgi:ribosomal protein S18 acetylase RimI-like enzyme